MTELAREQILFLPKETSVQALLDLSSSKLLGGKDTVNATNNKSSKNHSNQPGCLCETLDPFHCTCLPISNNQASNNEAKLFTFGGWETNNISASITSGSSHCILSPSSSQSLSSKSSSQIHSSQSNNTLRPKLSSCCSSRRQNSGVKSVIRGYIEPEPISYKFEHHDVNMVVLHMDRYRKVYTYPNMERKCRSMENQSLINTSSTVRSVYSTALVRPKLFVHREGRNVTRISRRNQAKQVYRKPSPQSSCEPFTEPVLVATNIKSSTNNDPVTLKHQSSSSTESSKTCDVPKRPYSTLRTQYRTSLLESSIKEKETQYRHSSLPLAQSITSETTKKEYSKKDRTFRLMSMSSGGAVDMTWVPERSSSSPLVITPVKSSMSLCLYATPTSREERKPSNNVIKRENKLYIDTRTKTKTKSQPKNRSKTPQANAQHTFPFKKYDMRILNSPTIPLLTNETSHLAVNSATKSGQTLLLGHRYHVNFRSKQPAFRYETLCLQGNTNSHTPQPISIATGPWIAPY